MEFVHTFRTAMINLYIHFHHDPIEFTFFMDKILFFDLRRYIFIHILFLIFQENGLRYGFLSLYKLPIIVFIFYNLKQTKPLYLH